MTVSTETNIKQYSGNGSTTEFSFPYLFLENSDITVYLTVDSTGVETLQVLNTDYTLTGAGTGTGTVTMTTAPASTETLTIFRDTELTQDTDFLANGTLPSESIETGLDKQTLQNQYAKMIVDRSVHLTPGSVNGSGRMDAQTNRIINVTNPTANQDAATKAYVDAQLTATALATDNVRQFYKITLSDGTTAGEEYNGTLVGGTLSQLTGQDLYLFDTSAVTTSTIAGPTINIDTLGAFAIYDGDGGTLDIGAVKGGAYQSLLCYWNDTNNHFVTVRPAIPDLAIESRNMAALGAARMGHETLVADGAVSNGAGTLSIQDAFLGGHDHFRLYFAFQTQNTSGSAVTDIGLEMREASAWVTGANSYGFRQNANAGSVTAAGTATSIDLNAVVPCGTGFITFWNGYIDFQLAQISGRRTSIFGMWGNYESGTNTFDTSVIHGTRMGAATTNGFRMVLSNATFENTSRYWLYGLDEGWGI